MTGPAEDRDDEAADDLAPKDLPPRPKKKLSLRDQAEFLQTLRLRCRMRGPTFKGEDAAETLLRLTRDDLEAIDCIVETIDLFSAYGADRFVRDEIMRKRPRK